MFGILCFGDSITFGRGELPNKGWVGRLKDYFETQDEFNSVYNLGVPGHISSDLLKRFDAECVGRLRKQEDRYVSLISIGINDCKWEGTPEGGNQKTTEQIFEKNIKELIKKGKNYQTKLAFIGLTPVDESLTLPYEDTSFKNERVQLFNDIVKKCCEESNVLFLDMFKILSNEEYTKFLSDGLHPNAKGYDRMYEIIKKFLIENKLIES